MRSMRSLAWPATAAWSHHGARAGFEVAFFERRDDGMDVHGCTTALEDGQTWMVEYAIVLDVEGRTRTARIAGRSAAGRHAVHLERDAADRWRVNGALAPRLDGCIDVDLESSALTNAFPVHRFALAVGGEANAPAAYVRAVGLGVERLEQRYRRVADEGAHACYEYAAPAFGLTCRIVYDEAGLVLRYPGIAMRAT
jgi:hypothetical protein